MPMPEAAMDEDYGPVLWKQKIRAARNFPWVEAVPEPEGM
jgi:hypothetical protein